MIKVFSLSLAIVTFACMCVLGGYSICAEKMSGYNVLARTCTGGKLLEEIHSITFAEQLEAALREGLVWLLLVGFIIAIPLLVRVANPSLEKR
jgi:hypothetical protein